MLFRSKNMSENEKTMQTEQPKAAPGNVPFMSPTEAAEKVSKGRFKLLVPIEDGEQKNDELVYDFNRLTGWELARAIDSGADRNANPSNVTDTQALSLFAVAAAKCTGGLDEKEIKERLSAQDAIAAISVASIFFKGSLLAGSLRITKE